AGGAKPRAPRHQLGSDDLRDCLEAILLKRAYSREMSRCFVADPGIRELSFGGACGLGIAARLVELGEPVIGPAVVRCAPERLLELFERLAERRHARQQPKAQTICGEPLGHSRLPFRRLRIGDVKRHLRHLLASFAEWDHPGYFAINRVALSVNMRSASSAIRATISAAGAMS